MINQHNIANYIDFLHLRKYGVPASQDLKSKWAQVPNSEVNNQLQMLYAHWNMSASDGKAMEQDFLSQQSMPPPVANTYIPEAPIPAATTSVNAHISPNAQPIIKQKKNNTGIIVLSIFIIGALIGYIVYDKLTNKTEVKNDASVLVSQNQTKENPASSANTNTPDSDISTAATASTKADENVEIEAEKTARTAIIRKLVDAEDRRDIQGILSTFSANMTEYWDMKKPTAEQLKKRYEHTWSISEENQIKNPSIKRISKNVYDLFGEYNFFSVKDQQYKTVPVHTRFVFDEQGKIIKTYGVKK